MEKYFLNKKVCVIDNGTGYTKMGWAGNTDPSFDIPTVIADHVDKQCEKSRLTKDLLDFYIGNEAQKYSKSHNVIYPMSNGIIENWDLMEKFWHRSIFDYMRAEPEETVFILTESPLNPSKNREFIAEIYFESFNAKALSIQVQAVLSLYTSSWCPANDIQRKSGLTGMVLDSGDGYTHCIPVSDGYVIGSCIKSFPIVGRDISKFVQSFLKDRGENIVDFDIWKAAREIKEQFGYVVPTGDLVAEFAKYDRKKEIGPGQYQQSNNFKKYNSQHLVTKGPYSVDVGYERFLGPELFFHPEFIDGKYRTSIDETLDKAIQTSPIDCRRKLYGNVVLSGGSTLFDGFAVRLQSQIQNRVNERLSKYQAKSGVKPSPIDVNVTQNPHQRYSVWKGGSLMATMPKFEEVYHTRNEYMEQGPQIARHNAVI